MKKKRTKDTEASLDIGLARIHARCARGPIKIY